MLEVSGISKHFGAVTALEDAALTLVPGEIRALLGANGSGKSTLAKILGGLVEKDGGVVKLDGSIFEITSPGHSRAKGIAVAYQDLSLVPNLTVEENIMLGNEPRKGFFGGQIDRKTLHRKAVDYLEDLDIQIDPQILVRNLDIAEQSLVEVAKAISLEAGIIILDEVTAPLHHDQVEKLFSLLYKIKEKGQAILFISHRLEEVFKLCDTATILRNGRTVASLSLDEASEADLVYHMTGKRPELIEDYTSELEYNEASILLYGGNIHVSSKVKGVSFNVYEGEILGFGGLKGQGQAELLRAVYGAVPFSRGQVSFNNKAIEFNSPEEAIHQGIGFISGDRDKEGILPVRSVAENISLARIARTNIFSSIDPGEIKKDVLQMIERLNIIAGSTEHEANSLSGGNQQKLLIGRWLMITPRLLILDDPTKGVDVSARREIHQILRQLTEEGTSVIYSSSDNEELLHLCDRILVFYEGTVSAELKGDTKTEEQLASAMLGIKQVKGGET